MNVEKEVTINELKAKFSKDSTSSSAMNASLEFTVGKCCTRTQVIEAQGKEAVWKDTVSLIFFDQTHISVRCYEGDESDKEYMGSGKLQIKSLGFPGGALDVNITTDNGEIMGSVSCKYTIKNLNAVPLLFTKNLKLELIKQNKQLAKTRPFIQISTEQGNISTEVKEEGSGTVLSWSDNLRLRIKQTSKINICLVDKDQSNTNIFNHQCYAKEFRVQSGCKRINVLDNSFVPLGQLSFDFETINLVSKEESVKNVEKEKKNQKELTALELSVMEYCLPKGEVDAHFKLILGGNCCETGLLSNANKEGKVNLDTCLYADPRQNKLIVVAYEKTMIKDQILASGSIPLDSISNGNNKIPLSCEDGKDQGAYVSINVSCKQIACKMLTLNNISINVDEEENINGNNEPYLLAKIGNCRGRTETGSGGKVNFKKGIELRFAQQDTLTLQIWDQDVAANSLLYSQTVPISSFKNKGEHSVNVSRTEQGQSEKKGKITFKYETKNNNSSPEPQRKPTVKEQAKKEEKQEEKKETDRDMYSNREKKNSLPSDNNMDTLTMNRSKETLNLPSIVASGQQNAYGDRIFDRQSAATLQKSIVAFSMPKANRFSQEPKYSGEPSYCVDSCFRKNTTKGAGFGFGRKKQFPDWMERNMKENPAPGSYIDLDDVRGKGPTFGLGHKYYERVMIPREKKPVHTTNRKLSPIRDPTYK